MSIKSNDPPAWWQLGVPGTNASLNFVGTTDSIDLVLRSNSIEGYRLTTAGTSRVFDQTKTLTANHNVAEYVGTRNVSYAGGTLNVVDIETTNKYAAAGTQDISVFIHPTIKNDPGYAGTLPFHVGIQDNSNVIADTTAITQFITAGMSSAPALSTVNGGTLSIGALAGLVTNPSIGAGATAFGVAGVYVIGAIGSGTATNQYAFYAETLTLATNNYGIYINDLSAKNILGGKLSVGTLSDPTATVDIVNQTATDVGLRIKGAASQSANYLNIVDSSNTALFTVADTSIGIGTASPTYNIHIKRTTDASIYLEADTDNVTEDDNAFIKFSQDGASVKTIIGGTGNVGFDPENVAYTGVIANSFLIGGQDSVGTLQFGTNSTVKATITNAGFMGIGTTAPTQLLAVGDPALVATATPASISMGASYSNTAGANFKLRLWDYVGSVAGFGISGNQLDYGVWTVNADHVFYQTSTELMRIKGTGLVGIGTAAPDVKLHILGSGTAVSNVNADSYLAVQASSAAGTDCFMSIISGTSGMAKLLLGDTAADNVGQVSYNNGDNSMRFITLSGERVRITSAGYVGISATAPATMLELEEVISVVANPTADGYAASITLDPGYTSGTAKTVTRHNYIDVQNVSNAGAGPSAVTDACVMRFDAAAGTHKAVDGSSTKVTGAAVDAWVKININGTVYYMPAYTSKTA